MRGDIRRVEPGLCKFSAIRARKTPAGLAGSGICAGPYRSGRLRPLSLMRVRTKPGQRTVTPMPSGLSRVANPSDRPKLSGLFHIAIARRNRRYLVAGAFVEPDRQGSTMHITRRPHPGRLARVCCRPAVPEARRSRTTSRTVARARVVGLPAADSMRRSNVSIAFEDVRFS